MDVLGEEWNVRACGLLSGDLRQFRRRGPRRGSRRDLWPRHRPAAGSPPTSRNASGATSRSRPANTSSKSPAAPTDRRLFFAETFGAPFIGIDINASGVAAANAAAAERGLSGAATFATVDATTPLPFADESFDAVQCIDAVNHLRDVLLEWRRVLRPGGLLLYTDPIVVTGIITSEEIATRSSIGFFLFVPAGENQRLLREAGFELVRYEDVTQNEVRTSSRWIAAREKRRDDLIAIEGADTYEGTQAFLRTVHALSKSRRLSRHLFVARKT